MRAPPRPNKWFGNEAIQSWERGRLARIERAAPTFINVKKSLQECKQKGVVSVVRDGKVIPHHARGAKKCVKG